MPDQRQRQLKIARQDALASGFDKTRQSPYSYACHACSRCCHGKAIQLNPYEIARLAEHVGVSTTEFIRRYTLENGTFLGMVESDQSCVFLGAGGCTVHPARPLVCRVYPLGRHTSPDGRESFADLVPHPHTAGEYGVAGTVGDYLQSQDAQRHLAAADAYWELFKRLIARLAQSQAGAIAIDAAGESEDLTALALDMDATVQAYCAKNRLPFPADVEEKTRLHLAALEALIA